MLAHEIAHVALRHHAYRELEVRRVEWMKYAAIALRRPRGTEQGAALAAAAWPVVGAGMLAAYTRDQEREADWLGQEIALAAGFDPRGMASFLRVLDHEKRLRLGAPRPAGYFDTHPGSIERVASATVRYEHVEGSPLFGGRQRREHLSASTGSWWARTRTRDCSSRTSSCTRCWASRSASRRTGRR